MMIYFFLMSVFATSIIWLVLLVLEEKMEKQPLEVVALGGREKALAVSIPEINCSSCGQKFTLDREHCPYCNIKTSIYWFEDCGQTKCATLFSHRGKDFLYFESKVVPLDDLRGIPSALEACFADRKRRAGAGKYVKLSPFVLTGILMVLASAVLVLPDAIHRITEPERAVKIQSYSDLIRETANLKITNSHIPKWTFRVMAYFCLLYSILGVVTGKVWSRYRLVCRSENPVFFHFLILAQLIFGLWFYFR